MDYADWQSFSGTVGLIIFVVVFIGVVAYALWPKNKQKFDHASRIPLQDDPDRTDDHAEDGKRRG